MTYEQNISLYKRVGEMITIFYKEQYPDLKKIIIGQKAPLVFNKIEFNHAVIMTVHASSYNIPDPYLLDKFLYDYCGIGINERKFIIK